jgi:iron complex transport system substrate-binding protein
MKHAVVPKFVPPDVENITRRDFLVGGAAALLLGGCGSGGGGSSSGETRTVEHALGTSEVPVSPQRIVDLTGGAGVDQLLTLGLVPVGSYGDPLAETGASEWIDEVEWGVDFSAEDIENVGADTGANVEKIATLEPDLIIGWDYAFEGVYDQLSEVAPSVGISPTNGPEWEVGFRKVAEAVGREARFQEWRESYERRIEELRESVGGDPSRYTASVLWNGDDSAIYLYGESSQPGSIVLDAGFSMPPITENFYDQISTEQLPEVDADAIFVMTNRKDIPEDRRDFTPTFGENELWQSLDAVKNGRIFPVEIFTWTNGGPTANRDILLPQLFAPFQNQ